MIRNLGLQAFGAIRNFFLVERKKSFTYSGLLAELVSQFPEYKNMNLKKRLYDVLNIFIALEYLNKEKSAFKINEHAFINAVPPSLSGKSGPQARFSAKQEKFLSMVAQLKKTKDELNFKLSMLNELEVRSNNYQFFMKFNENRELQRAAQPERPKRRKPAEENRFYFPLNVIATKKQDVRVFEEERTVAVVEGKILPESAVLNFGFPNYIKKN